MLPSIFGFFFFWHLFYLKKEERKGKQCNRTLSSRGSSALHSIFPWYVTRNEAKEVRGLEFYKEDTENQRHMAASLLPAVFHVLWFVHTYGQFDLEILVGASFGHGHLVEL